jgi:antitoxin component YwqK of YwqJK toxin-antitoxin module
MKTKILFLMMICAFFSFETIAQQNQPPQLQTIKTYHDLWKTKLYEVYTVKKNTGIKHGTYKSYDEDGNPLEEAIFKNNELNGPYKEYTNNVAMHGTVASLQNGLKVSANYLNGALHGNYTGYAYNSTINKNLVDVERVYDKGNIVSETEYAYNHNTNKNQVYIKRVYDKGNVISEIKYYGNGKQEYMWRFNGLFQSWYKNGQKQMEKTLKNGKENGKKTEWLENGQISVISFLTDDQLNGKATLYDPDGNLRQESNYEMGALVGTQIEYYPNDSIKVKQEYDTPDQLLSEMQYTDEGKKTQETVRINPETYLVTDYDSLSFHKMKETEKLVKKGRNDKVLKITTFYPNGKKQQLDDSDGAIYEYDENETLQLKAYPREHKMVLERANRKAFPKGEYHKYYLRQFEQYDENGQIIIYGYIGLNEKDAILGYVKCKDGAVIEENNWGDAAWSCAYLQTIYKD